MKSSQGNIPKRDAKGKWRKKPRIFDKGILKITGTEIDFYFFLSCVYVTKKIYLAYYFYCYKNMLCTIYIKMLIFRHTQLLNSKGKKNKT